MKIENPESRLHQPISWTKKKMLITISAIVQGKMNEYVAKSAIRGASTPLDKR